MNCNTGHLITQEMMDEMTAEKRKEYDCVPENLRYAANRKLSGKQEAHVSLSSGGKLSKFAGQTRKQRRFMAKQHK